MLRLIVNPAAGGGRAGRALGAVTTELATHEVMHRVDPTLSLEHARELTLEALDAGEMPVAFGGDGLIGAVADTMRGTGKPMGVLPGGRGNDFIRGLGIPLHPVAACSVLTSGRPVPVDVGVVADHSFLGIAICGYFSVANQIANDARLIRGHLVYTYGGLRALAGWKSANFRITIDGVGRELNGYTVAVANSARHGGGMMLAPDAKLDDGLFDVVLISDMSRLKLLRALPTVFHGHHVTLPEVEIVRARDVKLAADRPFRVFADGDPVSELPAHLYVDPGAVQVIVPDQPHA
jgi:YegS/Rv2252/BmrU family lipid kinase